VLRRGAACVRWGAAAPVPSVGRGWGGAVVLRWAAVVLLLLVVLRLVPVSVRRRVLCLRRSLCRGRLLRLLLRLRRQLRLLLRVRRLLSGRGGLLLLVVQQLRCRRAPGNAGLWRLGRWAGRLHWIAHV